MKVRKSLFALGVVVFLTSTVMLVNCKEAPSALKDVDKGVGPIKSVVLAAIDPNMAKKGESLFNAKCSACHKFGEKYVGPDLKGATARRAPEWIMNMMLNPAEMTQKDPVAKELLATHLVQMTFQDITKDDARSILEFFRQTDERKKS